MKKNSKPVNKNTKPVNKNNSSSDDNYDDYQEALMSTMHVYSNGQSLTDEEDNESIKPTASRINYVMSFINKNNLKPMVELDNCETENYVGQDLVKKILNAQNFFNSIDVTIHYLKSGTTGHTFKAISKTDANQSLAIKVVAYPKNDGYGYMKNKERPENAELYVLRLLCYFIVNFHAPHFVLPFTAYDTSITHFINIPKRVVNLEDPKNDMYKKFITRYNNNEFEDYVSVLLIEWCDGGDLLDYIRKNYNNMRLKDWTIIFFQLLYSLAAVQKLYPTFRHNDLKANNILLDLTDIKHNDPEWRYKYEIDNYSFLIPNINLQIRIWDFDFACIDGIIDNNKVNSDWTPRINVTARTNRYYDMHYFFNTLISKRFFPQFYESAPPEIIAFVHRIIPDKYRLGSKYVHRKGRILVDEEYTTPYTTITRDPLFDKYRWKDLKGL